MALNFTIISRGSVMPIDDVIIVDYDPDWPRRYEEERPRILSALGDIIVDIEHVGSTAIPGLAAKPIIDIEVAVRRLPLTDEHITALEKLDYEFRRYNEPWWAFLRKGMPRTHHLHIVDAGNETGRAEHEKTVLFRDYLSVHPAEARAYQALKRELAERFREERIAYGEHKTRFILATLEKAMAWRHTQI
ncbi:MAG: GrpB family protein [Chloroflexi bacterium]|nr:GrpB family protein [Chloroflexota bacterium]